MSVQIMMHVNKNLTSATVVSSFDSPASRATSFTIVVMEVPVNIALAVDELSLGASVRGPGKFLPLRESESPVPTKSPVCGALSGL